MPRSVGRLKLRIGGIRLKTLPKLSRGDEARADQFTPAPDQRAHPKHFSAGGEGEAEKLRHRQRADIEANAVVGHIDDQAFEPRRIRRRDKKSRLMQLDPNMPARAEVGVSPWLPFRAGVQAKRHD